MYLVLKRVFFFCALLANIQQAWQLGIDTLKKIILYRFARKSSFIGQGKNTMSIKTVLENLSRYLWYENQQLLPEILGGTNDRIKNYKKFSLWQPSLFTLLRAVRRLNTKDSNSQSDKSLLCYASVRVVCHQARLIKIFLLFTSHGKHKASCPICLVPRPHYSARPKRFGSRCPSENVRPRQKSSKVRELNGAAMVN